jgi:hypothetical protein
MFVSPVTENEVKYVINRLKGSLSAGFDDVPEVIVNRCSVYYYSLDPYIQFIFLTGYFSDTLKIAKIELIFKKRNEQDMKNYRLISILSVFSKILEKFMFNSLNSFVEKYIFLLMNMGSEKVDQRLLVSLL